MKKIERLPANEMTFDEFVLYMIHQVERFEFLWRENCPELDMVKGSMRDWLDEWEVFMDNS